ncbi:MAG TPA: DNA methyltransferase [Candidatus Cybelea sp.]|jgi:site-specific DNA-methyltransferase (adenine-specific)
MIDPWYNKGVGGMRDDYVDYIGAILAAAASLSDNVFLWGFPEIVARFVDRIPESLALTCWLSWYYKNTPSVIRGWRSSQMACLHLSQPGAKLYPEHFMNARQSELKRNGKLRYVPGPASVIEAPLLVGFVGRAEQTGHPAQKPVAVYEPIYRMVCKPGDYILDPMCGSGTSGVVAQRQGLNAVLADVSAEYTEMTGDRLGVRPCAEISF